LVYASD